MKIQTKLKAAVALVIGLVLMAGMITHVNAQTGQDLAARLAHIETALWGGPNVAGPYTITTVPGSVTAQTCGTTTTCAHTSIGTTLKIVVGSTALVSGTPSTAAVTGISPAFTSSSSFHCTVNNQTNQTHTVGVLAAGYVSGSAFTITGGNTLTDVIDYTCVGN